MKYEVEVSYQITGTITIQADNPEEAAREAERIVKADPSKVRLPSVDCDALTVSDDTDKVVWEA